MQQEGSEVSSGAGKLSVLPAFEVALNEEEVVLVLAEMQDATQKDFGEFQIISGVVLDKPVSVINGINGTSVLIDKAT